MLNYLLLFIWIAIGIGLRFTQLTLKSPWTDEFATMIFSLGNTYQTVPLDQAISLETLLQPLKLNSSVGVSAVIHHLLTEDHHPPLYFVFAHWWIQLFSIPEGYVSLWVARSLPAFLGVLSIPAVYGLGWLAFRSQLIAQLAAAMMAVSPYGIYLAQEARHYTLGILWVIASLSCLVVALQHLQHRILLPIWIALCWIIINSLGI
ncbi:MAG TPA: glycosyltransferase, partial [Cyanobacteria bacterium UBA12227]|nr:glycosyltransferase [Cyanobacteria bacterium UBA12227]